MKVQDWLESLRIPEGFPVLTIGWPDEEHGITEDAWKDYVDDLLYECEDQMKFQPLTFEAWRERERENISEETEFSHHNCDLCGALPGARHNATAFKEDLSDYVPLEVCSDCVCWIANGGVPDHLEGENG